MLMINFPQISKLCLFVLDNKRKGKDKLNLEQEVYRKFIQSCNFGEKYAVFVEY